ncbi:hypothetical protein E4U42_000042 [Claviceps africana]|uniref:Uncharacterized protein n=1 Tax=Claviceps africana TaxID=83212 RepID=A0A8K0NJS1_9HYPO|nr:hypothetical protein E4U42_000042 [Claviceps africana]
MLNVFIGSIGLSIYGKSPYLKSGYARGRGNTNNGKVRFLNLLKKIEENWRSDGKSAQVWNPESMESEKGKPLRRGVRTG